MVTRSAGLSNSSGSSSRGAGGASRVQTVPSSESVHPVGGFVSGWSRRTSRQSIEWRIIRGRRGDETSAREAASQPRMLWRSSTRSSSASATTAWWRLRRSAGVPRAGRPSRSRAARRWRRSRRRLIPTARAMLASPPGRIRRSVRTPLLECTSPMSWPCVGLHVGLARQESTLVAQVRRSLVSLRSLRPVDRSRMAPATRGSGGSVPASRSVQQLGWATVRAERDRWPGGRWSGPGG